MREIMSSKYKEILRLDQMLTESGVPHKLNLLYDGYQIFLSVKRKFDCRRY